VLLWCGVVWCGVVCAAVRHGAQFDDVVSANKTSGMVQSWNKFCFTGEAGEA